jgi:hypothetical protein
MIAAMERLRAYFDSNQRKREGFHSTCAIQQKAHFLLFRVQGAEILRLDAQEQAVA